MASQAVTKPGAPVVPRAPGINRRVIEALTGYLFITPYLIVAIVFLFGGVIKNSFDSTCKTIKGNGTAAATCS